MSDKHTPQEIFNLQFADLEIDALIEVLKFANNAATVLAQQELKSNSVQNASKMNRMASDSKELMRIVIASVDIGEPENDERH